MTDMRKTWLKKLGKAIRFYRELFDFTQAQLAKKVGVDPQTISRWENGVMAPDVWHYYKMMKVFKCLPKK